MRFRIVQPVRAAHTIFRYGLLALAITCIGLYSYIYLERFIYQASASREFDQAARATGAVSKDKTSPFGGVEHPSQKTVSLAGTAAPTALIGRLSIPRLHLSAMVREGIDRYTLQLAIGHIPATALPGQPGNVAVAGHRDTLFRGLKDLRIKDEIQFSTFSGDFNYIVESLTIVEPENVAVLAPSAENVLTLVTCYPFSYIGTAPKRFVVRARQVSPLTVPASTVE